MSTFLRQVIYREIDRERTYQDRQHGGREHDKDHTVEDWLEFMDEYVTDAKALVRAGEQRVALEEIRKIVSLGIACLEVHGCPPRQV